MVKKLLLVSSAIHAGNGNKGKRIYGQQPPAGVQRGSYRARFVLDLDPTRPTIILSFPGCIMPATT